MVEYHSRSLSHSILTLMSAVALLSSCATTRRLEVKSTPVGADVVNRAGEKLGKTPLVLEGAVLEKTDQQGLSFLSLQLPGYEEKTMIVDPKAEMSLDVKLSKQEPNYFKNITLRDFSGEANVMVRELLRIQGLVIMRSVAEAQKALDDFQKQYPYIAASYVMLANVALMKQDVKTAKNYLLRAQTIDAIDPVILRMLKSLEPTR